MQFWPEFTYKLYTNSNVSCMRDVQGPVVVASEYNMIDNNLAPGGKDSCVAFHHIAVFCFL